MSQITILDSKLKNKVEAFQSLDGYEIRETLLAEVIRAELMNLRSGTSHSKTRAEVRGGGRKPWKQKGTGRARHGSTRSPIWVGGGVTFGPRNTRNWHLKINKSSRIAALKSALTTKLNSDVVFVFEDAFNYGQTKVAIPALDSIRTAESKTNKQTTIIYTTADKENVRGFLNTEALMMNIKQLKVNKLLNSRKVIFTPAAKAELEARLS
jgi:large subunit ribosomal protein L4